MFITERIDPIALLTEMLFLDDGDEAATAALGRLGHNKDLCPRFREAALHTLFAYEKHRVDVHDIQGFKDKGCDVALRFEDEEFGVRKAALQIKSQSEIKAWWGKKTGNMVGKLREQYVQATQDAGVEVWYLILCADVIVYRDAIRHIVEAFSSYDKVKIITPTRAATFLALSEAEIEAHSARILCRRDVVRQRALRELQPLGPVAARVAVDLICSAINSNPRIDDETLIETIAANADNDLPVDEGLILAELHDRVLALDDHELHLIPDSAPAIHALYYEQRVRFEADPDGISERLKIILDLNRDGQDGDDA